jgi:hypothetical protein
MREGRYFRIPEGPIDLLRLWREGSPVLSSERPAWMASEDTRGYRSIGWVAWPVPREREPIRYLAELEELRTRGVIVDQHPDGGGRCQFYLRAPTGPWNNDAIFSIGVYTGWSPLTFAGPDNIPNPVLTAREVTDIPAAFVADPFLIKRNELWHMFFEVMNARTGNGEIGLAVSLDLVNWHYEQIVLAEPFHLSYPYVFEWGGTYYLVPESHQAGAVRLYKAARFPTQWSFVGTMLEGAYLADPSPFRHQGKWWLFVDASQGMDNETLRLYSADNLLGPWHEHPKSPVIQGNSYIARPAGRVITYQNKLYRFAQACLPYYGTDVRGFEIAELTPRTYREVEVRDNPLLRPQGSGWNACGMHHVDPQLTPAGWWVASVDGWSSESILLQQAGLTESPPP